MSDEVDSERLAVTLHVGARAFHVGQITAEADVWRDELVALLRESAEAIADVDLSED